MGRKEWYVVLVENNDETIIEVLRSGEVVLERESEILASGWGEEVPEKEWESALKKYPLFHEAKDTSE